MQFNRRSAAALALAAAALAACSDSSPTAPSHGTRPSVAPAPGAALSAVVPSSSPVLDAHGYTAGHPAMTSLLEADGTYSVQSQGDYDFYWTVIAPQLNAWAADARLGLNPNYVAAILTKESGFDSLAVSWMPANGLPQITYIADADMQQMVTSADFAWMQTEVAGWARNAIVHSSTATHDATVGGLQQGTITSANEYLFNPVQSVRGAVFWLRLLENKWTTDDWPGGYGTFARNALNGGAPLTESQLVDLVTVSYNQGYDWVYSLVSQYGTQWTAMLAQQGAAGTEAADYLDRVRNFTGIYEDAATALASSVSPNRRRVRANGST